MDRWLTVCGQVEALEDASFDAALVEEMQRHSRAWPGTVNFHVPSFKAFATPEITGCGKDAWPAVSITGGACKLKCDHCRARILETMIPAPTPEALWETAVGLAERGARGMLLSGGSNHRNEVEYGPFFPVIHRIKHAFPRFRIALHTALVDRDTARRIEDCGIDAAMLDIIGAQETITRVYHLKRTVDDFERALECLVATRLKVVPHIVLGLHYGRLLGERHALEIIRRHKPSAVVLVVVMPFYASPARPFAVPDSREIGRFFLDARRALPDIPLLLGCARPGGRAKTEIDAYAVMGGLDGIAHPADGAVELAARLGREVTVSPSCCSIAVGGEVMGESEGPRFSVDVAQLIEREKAARQGVAIISPAVRRG
jgi:uncharacterized radical SAM superfamily protein